MSRAYYLFNPGRMSRRDNTLKFIPVNAEGVQGAPRFIPVEDVSALYIFGSLDTNSALYNFLGRKHIPVHFFDYHKHYTGTFSPREHLLAGKMVVEQTKAYLKPKRRLHIAKRIIEGATYNMLKTLRYYGNRGKDVSAAVGGIDYLRAGIKDVESVPELMGIEGNCRRQYYEAFDVIVDHFEWDGRKKKPPRGELNALVSFGNAMCYSLCVDAIYNSQLNPTISYLHEPGTRRYSLALDVAEIFKPILVDRLIFRLCNKREIREEHFDNLDQASFLSETGRKVFLRAWEERLDQTIEHRNLHRRVSYRRLVRLECYKIAKHVLGMEKEYEPFKIWW
ncbi:MAG: type I-B CRISPR-associated endonuclease Cas1b [Saprospiraceae bacterium]